jgi:hypothetical protein
MKEERGAHMLQHLEQAEALGLIFSQGGCSDEVSFILWNGGTFCPWCTFSFLFTPCGTSPDIWI